MRQPHIYREKVTGARADRRELSRMLGKLAPGDVVTVTRIDRLARSTFDLFCHHPAAAFEVRCSRYRDGVSRSSRLPRCLPRCKSHPPYRGNVDSGGAVDDGAPSPRQTRPDNLQRLSQNPAPATKQTPRSITPASCQHGGSLAAKRPRRISRANRWRRAYPASSSQSRWRRGARAAGSTARRPCG
jgi:hypothetical protein